MKFFFSVAEVVKKHCLCSSSVCSLNDFLKSWEQEKQAVKLNAHHLVSLQTGSYLDIIRYPATLTTVVVFLAT